MLNIQAKYQKYVRGLGRDGQIVFVTVLTSAYRTQPLINFDAGPLHRIILNTISWPFE